MNATNTTDASLFPPDSEHLKIAMWITMFLYLAYSSILLVLLVIRRKHQPVRVRIPALLFYHVVMNCVMLILLHTRIIVGRDIFPCFIYTATYYFSVPEIAVPHLFRMFRFIVVFKIARNIGTNAYDNKIKILRMLMTTRFTVLAIAFVAILHVIFWLVGMGIVTAIDNIPQYSTQGCRLGSNTYFVVAIIILYLIILLVMIFAILTQVKDTWGIRLEVVIMSTMWIIAVTLFCILNFLPQYISCCEFSWFPAGYVIYIASILDTAITCLLPVVLSFRNTKSNVKDVNEQEVLHIILNNEQYRAELKEFSIQSFCPENILFWEEIQQYNNLGADSERETKIRELYKKYLCDDAIAELNLSDKVHSVRPVMDAMNEFRDKGTPIPPNLLDGLIKHCCEDMMDVFSRFQLLARWKDIEMEIFNNKKEYELMAQAGMLQVH